MSPEEKVAEQQRIFANILQNHGVNIVWADAIPSAKYQLFTRDPFMVIDDTFVVNHMHESPRSGEHIGAYQLLKTIDPSKVLHTPKDAIIEGGDVIPHDHRLFVGQDGMRTDSAGLEFIKRKFGDKFDVTPIHIHPSMEANWLRHLDCMFNPVSEDTALVAPTGLKDKSLYLLEYIFQNIVEASEQERNELGTNVFSLGNKTVVVQERHGNIIRGLRDKGFAVETINSYATTEGMDGYSRCMTCPLEREQ